MKGVIADCLSELVIKNFGKDKWENILEKTGLDKRTSFAISADIDDGAILNVLGNTCDVLGITLEQAADAFGEYWAKIYAPEIYWAYFSNWKSAKDCLTDMDRIHERVTRRIANARPPRFDYEWRNENTLIMTYKSKRGLIDIFIGLVRGVARSFNENLTITKLDDRRVQIEFPR